MSDSFTLALENVLQLHVLGVILACAAYGLFVGAIPGLTATMAVALLIPVTFFLDDISALAAIVTLEACAIFAGDIPTTLVRIPGTPSSAAYTNDAYALARAGRGEQSLGVSLVFSVIGGLFGAVLLMTAGPLLAGVAFQFTTYEYFWLYVLGLSCAAVVAGPSPLKGALALVIGLLFSTVGLSAVHSAPRFTFGQSELMAGINFIPAMIGLFGLSEVLRNVLWPPAAPTPTPPAHGPEHGAVKGSVAAFLAAVLWQPLRLVFSEALPMFRRRIGPVLRSGLIGSLVGMLPGAGADIGAWISYAASKRFSNKPHEYGEGSLEGIADATGANNAALAGAWIPALVFGIPGDSITAIVIGVLLMKNITPGYQIFTDPKQSVLVYGIYTTFILANLALIPLGFLAIRTGGFLVRMPRRVLLPIIVLFSIVGSYAINGSYFDVGVMLGMGILGFGLEAVRVPLGPVVLGIILGEPVERSFIQNLTKSESLACFVSRPLAALLALVCLLLWLLPPVLAALRRSGKRVN